MNSFPKFQFDTLFAYHWQTNHRLLEIAGQLDRTDYFNEPGHGHGSIHDLFFHLLRADQSWRAAIITGQQQAGSKPVDYPDLESVQAGFQLEQTAWQACLSQLSEEAIETDLELTNQRGEVFRIALWRIIQHLILHGMQHHTEIAQLLTNLGRSPGDIDFIFFG